MGKMTELTHRHAQADEAGGGPPVLRGHQRIVDAEDAQRAARRGAAGADGVVEFRAEGTDEARLPTRPAVGELGKAGVVLRSVLRTAR